MAKGGKQQTSTTTSQPWDKAVPGLQDALKQISAAYGNTGGQLDAANRTYGNGGINLKSVGDAYNGILAGNGGIGGLLSGNGAGANSALSSMLAGKPDYAAVNR